MTLSQEDIYRPLTDFFLNQFKTDAGSRVLFRFDKFGSVVCDEDFIDLNHPEWGYRPGKAREKFSDLVNHIPIDTGDGMNILLSEDSIDSTYYFRLLFPSTPYIPPGTDADTQQAIMAAFGKIRGEAEQLWESMKPESLTGLMLEYKPSLATPENWYDTSSNDAWTRHSFQVTGTSSTPVASPSTQLWKLKPSDALMQEALHLHLPEVEQETAKPPSLNIPARILELRAKQLQKVPAGGAELSPLPAPALPRRLVIAPSVTQRIAEAHKAGLYEAFLRESNALDIGKKILVAQYIGDHTPTQSVKTSSISISFDYCLVNIRRPWYVDAFINDKSWLIPSVPKGQITSSGPVGNLSLMPIGFVAIRNLSIEDKWTTEDEANAALATDFGPFKVTWDPVNKKLSHPGLQIIGWVLQKMPDLPPNDPPGLTLEVPQQLSPADGSVFNNYPRTTTLEWTSARNAASYTVELDCYHCCEANKWCSDVGKIWKIVPNLQTTSYTFQFVGAQPGRWRVWAVDASGHEGAKSPWSVFQYTV